jgi:hypothetical protein
VSNSTTYDSADKSVLGPQGNATSCSHKWSPKNSRPEKSMATSNAAACTELPVCTGKWQQKRGSSHGSGRQAAIQHWNWEDRTALIGPKYLTSAYASIGNHLRNSCDQSPSTPPARLCVARSSWSDPCFGTSTRHHHGPNVCPGAR